MDVRMKSPGSLPSLILRLDNALIREECAMPLLVAVAELATHGIHQGPKDLVLASKSKGEAIGELPLT